MNPKTISKAKKMIKGLTLEWNDTNPTEEAAIEKPKISHKNPVLRLAASQMLADYSNYIFKRLRFKWEVTITMFFRCDGAECDMLDAAGFVGNFECLQNFKTGEVQEEVILNADCYLADLNDLCLSEIKAELKRHTGKTFYNSRFFIECVGV